MTKLMSFFCLLNLCVNTVLANVGIHKRYLDGEIVYYNPITDSGCSNYTSSNSATGFTGSSSNASAACMRWFAYKDTSSSSTVKLLLDHNTTDTQVWNSSNSNVALASSSVYPKLTALKNTNGCASVPDLIDDNDIADIIGYSTIRKGTTWDSTSTSNYFYFETATTSKGISYNQSSKKSRWWWLYDRTGPSSYPCTSYGCVTASGSKKRAFERGVLGFY